MRGTALLTGTVFALLIASAHGGQSVIIDCNEGKNVTMILDFNRGANGEPILNDKLKIVSATCTPGPPIYRIIGLYMDLGSKENVENILDFVRRIEAQKALEQSSPRH